MTLEINLSLTRPETEPGAGPIVVGWFLTDDKGGVLFDPPERLMSRGVNKTHAKSAARCPAVIQLESRQFVFKCPYDLHLGFTRDDKGAPALINRAGDASSIRSNKLRQVLTLVNEAEWRFANRPTIQLILPYCFIADEVVYLSQIGPFAHYRPEPLPGTIFGGRFPINVWPRPLMWAFEWHDPTKDIILKRGEPLFYCQFEGIHPDRRVELIEAERTPELTRYMDQISGVVNYVSQTFNLFSTAESMRPPKLLTPKGASGNRS